MDTLETMQLTLPTNLSLCIEHIPINDPVISTYIPLIISKHYIVLQLINNPFSYLSDYSMRTILYLCKRIIYILSVIHFQNIAELETLNLVIGTTISNIFVPLHVKKHNLHGSWFLQLCQFYKSSDNRLMFKWQAEYLPTQFAFRARIELDHVCGYTFCILSVLLIWS